MKLFGRKAGRNGAISHYPKKEPAMADKATTLPNSDTRIDSVLQEQRSFPCP